MENKNRNKNRDNAKKKNKERKKKINIKVSQLILHKDVLCKKFLSVKCTYQLKLINQENE